MNAFTPKKLLAFTVVFECLSRAFLICAMYFVSILNVKFLVPILFFAAFNFISKKYSLDLGGEAKKKLRSYFQNKFLSMPPVQDRNEKGMPMQELSLHYIKTADLMEPWYSRFLPSAFVAVIVPCMILSVMFFIDVLTFVILLLTGLLLPLFLTLIGKAAKKKSEEQWQSLSRLRAFFLESLQGFKTIKIFKKVKEREQDLLIAEGEFSEKTLAVLKIAFLSALVQEWASSLSIALVAVGLAFRLLDGGIGFNTAFLALLLTPEFYRPIRQFGVAFHIAINAKTAWNSVC